MKRKCKQFKKTRAGRRCASYGTPLVDPARMLAQARRWATGKGSSGAVSPTCEKLIGEYVADNIETLLAEGYSPAEVVDMVVDDISGSMLVEYVQEGVHAFMRKAGVM
jgi:hypothetical protein